uniref:Serpin domain-containing protein n=1 Tax=Panagrolaimus sp. ES5 TaxID=591445 RepID=A0AC34FIH7_9BILA
MSQAMVNAQANFALNLLRDSNVTSSTILSPISISFALAMVYLGAKENTAAQIRNTIAKDIPEEEIHAYFSSVLSHINSKKLDVTLESVNLLGLPYKNKQVTMYIILPRERFGLNTVVNEMNATTLTQLLANKDSTTVLVQLPRFKIESSFQLVDALKKLGIKDAFDENSTNFSGISEEGDLKISDVIHKAFIEVCF